MSDDNSAKGGGGVVGSLYVGLVGPAASLLRGCKFVMLAKVKFRRDDPERPERGNCHDRQRHGNYHFENGDRDSPIDVDGFFRDGRIPAVRLIDIDGSIRSESSVMAPPRRPIPFFCVLHSASIAWI